MPCTLYYSSIISPQSNNLAGTYNMYDTICIDMYRHRAFTERGCLIGDSRIDPVAKPYPRKDGIGVSIIYYVTNVITKGGEKGTDEGISN